MSVSRGMAEKNQRGAIHLLCSTWTSSCHMCSTCSGSPVKDRALVSRTNIENLPSHPTIFVKLLAPFVSALKMKFMKNFSSIAAPLHALTSHKIHFSWTPQTEESFQFLKDWFTTATVLVLSDPRWQFVVEVDASVIGVCAILSQRHPPDGQLHPCAFLSRKLSSTKRNYDISNCELLAVKVALEEWWHWLERMEQHFLVWTNHKNLADSQTFEFSTSFFIFQPF